MADCDVRYEYDQTVGELLDNVLAGGGTPQRLLSINISTCDHDEQLPSSFTLLEPARKQATKVLKLLKAMKAMKAMKARLKKAMETIKVLRARLPAKRTFWSRAKLMKAIKALKAKKAMKAMKAMRQMAGFAGHSHEYTVCSIEQVRAPHVLAKIFQPDKYHQDFYLRDWESQRDEWDVCLQELAASMNYSKNFQGNGPFFSQLTLEEREKYVVTERDERSAAVLHHFETGGARKKKAVQKVYRRRVEDTIQKAQQKTGFMIPKKHFHAMVQQTLTSLGHSDIVLSSEANDQLQTVAEEIGTWQASVRPVAEQPMQFVSWMMLTVESNDAVEVPRVLATVAPPNWTGQLSHVHLGGAELALLAREEGCPVAVLTALRLGIPLVKLGFQALQNSQGQFASSGIQLHAQCPLGHPSQCHVRDEMWQLPEDVSAASSPPTQPRNYAGPSQAVEVPRVLATVPPPNWTGQLSHVHLGGPELALLAWEEGCPVAVLTALRLGIPLTLRL
ncbi:unnamed protein product [Symbiodinium microadriaticum]|nr:unnamed protein product [Symbiodinium microadriaticum]